MDGSNAWTTLEKMALAKYVFKCGDGDWNAVSRTLKQNYGHSRASDFFSQKNCAAQYARLVRQFDQIASNRPDQVNSDKVPDVVVIARLLYLQRIEELKKAIQNDEDTFRNISHELVEIRQGKWDERLDDERISVNADEIRNTTTLAKEYDGVVHEAQVGSGNGNVNEDRKEPDENKRKSSTQQIASERTDDSRQEELTDESDMIDKEGLTPEVGKCIETSTSARLDAVKQAEKEDPATESSGHLPVDDKQSGVSSISENGTLELTTSMPTTKLKTAENVSDSNDAITTQHHNPSNADSEIAKTEATVAVPLQSGSPVKKFTTEDNENDGSTQKEAGFGQEPAEVGTKERPLTRLRKRTLSGVLDMLPPLATTVVEATAKGNPEVGSTEDEIVQPVKEDDTQEYHFNVSQAASNSRESELDDDAMVPVRKKVKKAALRRDSEDAESNISSDVDLSDAGSGPHSLRSPSYSSSRLTPPGVIIGDAERAKRWRKLILPIWSHIANHRHGPMFMQSIREKEAPGYYSAVKRPMSLSDVKKRVNSGAITTTAEFHRDVLQVFANALMYNKENTDIYGMASELQADAQLTIKQHVQTERAVTRRDSCGPSGRRKSGSVTSVSDEVYTPLVTRGEPSTENQDCGEASTPGETVSS